MDKITESLSQLSPHILSDKKIWSIGGGKGGVGKSLMAANTAISLAQKGHKVVAIDLDLGGANLHTCLGVGVPAKTLSDYITGKVTDLNELVVSTPIPNLGLISGAQDELGMANLRNMQKNKLLAALNKLNAEYIILDLGAGTTHNTLDFFIAANKGMLVVLPEPTSIENTYRFIKSVFFRRLKVIEDFLEIQPLIQQAMSARPQGQMFLPSDLVKKVAELNPVLGQKLQNEISKFKFYLIMNQVRTPQDIEIGNSIKNVAKKYFGVDIYYIGHLEYDASVWQSIKRRKPVTTEYPNSPLVLSFKKIVAKLMDGPMESYGNQKLL
jgi:flagellar biosynthesis protein FlhG